MIRRLIADFRARRAEAHTATYTDGEFADMRRTVWRLIRGVRR